MNWKAKWIKPVEDMGDVAPKFVKAFAAKGEVKEAFLTVTAQGIYDARINGKRVSDYVLAPGFTAYTHRLQYQTYDVTEFVQQQNRIEVLVGKGWYRSRLLWCPCPFQEEMQKNPAGLFLELAITYADGSYEIICSDESWQAEESKVRFSEIYDGEIYDAGFVAEKAVPVVSFEGPTHTLIPQQGEEIKEQEILSVAKIFTTPKGEVVVDFGQEITGYVEINLEAAKGEVVDISFAEVMDKEGNFYNENYRSAKCQYHYVCTEGKQSYKPLLTFYGFRYLRINEFPGGPKAAKPEHFTAIVVHSQMRRIGHLNSSDPLLNRLIENVFWGQKCNYLDVPTDCPQRDERMGWTGDAQVFMRTACLNYDVEKFFTKWLADMAAEQFEDGHLGNIIPDLQKRPYTSAAWGDAATICPWEIYLNYGNKEILEKQFECMKNWVGYITSSTKDQYLWTGGIHFGDWLGLDAPSGSYKGSSRDDLIATAFYAHSTSLIVKAGKVLGKDMTEYEELYEHIKEAFQKTYPEYKTQTECVLAAHFKLAKCPQAAADQLAEMVRSCGVKLQTGFVGTPYLLHVLSDYGYAKLAYSLLLKKTYPSWLYPVTKGATTIWEHWDGIMEDGGFWSADMNSYNHYAYGAVADWLYSTVAGIKPIEEAPGFAKVAIAPVPDARLGWFTASLETRHGKIISKWIKEKDMFKHEITTPVEAEITIAGETKTVPAGSYVVYSPLAPNTEDKIVIEGHRGYCAQYPENTMISFEAALDLGVDAIEFDVWLTQDKVPVLMHDCNAKRTCGVDKNLRDMTLEEVKQLEPAYTEKFEDKFVGKGVTVPTLEELLILCKEKRPDMILGVEIKEYTEENVDLTVALLKKYGFFDRCYFYAFNGRIIKYLKTKYNGRTMGYPDFQMGEFESDTYDYYDEIGVCMSLVKSELCDYYMAKGLPAHLFCADTEEDVEICIKKGAALITANDPVPLMKRLGREVK